MKVIQISSVCKSGSVAKIAVQIQKLLLRLNNESAIAYGRGPSLEGVNSYKFSSETEVYIHAILSRITDRHGLYSRKATQRLVAFLKKEKPDIIHIHCLHGYYINYEILFNYLKDCGIPVVWTFHDCWAITGHCAYFEESGCDRWKTGCFSCPSKKMYPTSFICDASEKNYKLKKKLFNSVGEMIIVTPSEWLKKIVSESFLSSYETVVINNGIDTDVFCPIPDKKLINDVYDKYLPFDYQSKKIVLGVANVWAKRKGLEDFIKLSNMLDDEFKIVLVGLSDAQIKALPKNVVGIKRTDSAKELAALYNGAYCFCNLTYEDNYPTTNIEALSCGAPVISYDTGGSGEMIEDKTCVVEKGNLERVKNLLENYPLKRIYVGDKFDSRYKFSEYVELYKKLNKGSLA